MIAMTSSYQEERREQLDRDGGHQPDRAHVAEHDPRRDDHRRQRRQERRDLRHGVLDHGDREV